MFRRCAPRAFRATRVAMDKSADVPGTLGAVSNTGVVQYMTPAFLLFSAYLTSDMMTNRNHVTEGKHFH